MLYSINELVSTDVNQFFLHIYSGLTFFGVFCISNISHTCVWNSLPIIWQTENVFTYFERTLFISKLSFAMIHNIEYNEKRETYSSSSTNVIAKKIGAFSKVVASWIANEIFLELQSRIYISCVLYHVNVYILIWFAIHASLLMLSLVAMLVNINKFGFLSLLRLFLFLDYFLPGVHAGGEPVLARAAFLLLVLWYTPGWSALYSPTEQPVLCAMFRQTV